jgi:iron complex outermembrane receptor protein
MTAPAQEESIATSGPARSGGDIMVLSRRRLHVQASSVAALSCVLAAGLAGGAHAQDESASRAVELGEIIVTAQKRSENLQAVPTAVTAFGSEALEKRGFTRIEDLSTAVPNLNIVNASDARTAQFTIRGITGQTLFPGSESSVGIFIDGVYVNNPIAQNFDILDVERVEVLRGPQGTLYGRNTTAGAINLVSRKPTGEFSGSGLIELGNYNSQRLRAGVGGPLVDGLLYGQVSASYRKRDGLGRNTTRGDEFDTADVASARVALRFTPSDALEINFSLDGLSEDRVPGSMDPTPFDRKDDFNAAISERREVYGANLTVDYAFESGPTLTSISAFRDYDFKRVGDDDGSPLDGFISPVTESTWQFSEELRLASPSGQRFEWVAGAYYLKSKLEGSSTPYVDPDVVFQLNVGVACSLILPAFLCAPGTGDNYIAQEAETVALFGQGTYRLNDQLSLTLGGRASRETKDFVVRQTSTELPLFMAVASGTAQVESTTFSPMATLAFKPNDNINIYGKASKAFKSGGFNTSPVATAAQLANITFADEELWSYEAGIKSTWLDRRLLLNVAAFRIEYKDLQVFRYEETSPGVFSSRITNAASAINYGVEVELQAIPTPGVLLEAGLGYTKSEFDSFPNCGVTPTVPPTAEDCSGNQLTYAPKLTFNLSATYDVEVTDALTLSFFGDWSYRDRTYFNIFNDRAFSQGDYALFNGSITLAKNTGDWAVSLWGENLADKDYVTFAIPGFAGSVLRHPGAPRTYGVRLTGRF